MGSVGLRDAPSKPLVSAIIPTHNRAHLLPRALESMLAQEGRGDIFELEVIVVDDASSDSTPGVVRRYPGVRYIRLPAPRGVSAALNAGVQASRGALITFLGDDDEWLAHKLRTQVPLLASNPEVGVVYGQYLIRVQGHEEVRPKRRRARSGWVFFDMLLENFCGHHAALLVRRDAVEKVGGFDESLSSWEDTDLSLRLARDVQFLFVPGVVTVYNQSRNGSLLSRVASGVAAVNAVRVTEKALRTLPDSDEYVAIRRIARARIAVWVAWWPAKVGDVAAARERLLATFALYPWATRHEWGTYSVGRLAVARVQSGERPLAVVRDLFAAVNRATGGNRPALRWWAGLLVELTLRRLRSRSGHRTAAGARQRISGQARAGRALT